MSTIKTDEQGVTKKLVKWSTKKRKAGSRKWHKKWVVVAPRKGR